MQIHLPIAIQQLADEMPVARFTTNPLWIKARWTATTFQWHPTSEAPPILGLVFENAEAGRQLFRELEAAYNHTDRFEEMRISIIEGASIGQRYGYTVHICPDPDALAMYATGKGIVLTPQTTLPFSKWNRMYPVVGTTPLLPRFKEEFEKHAEFLLAPVTKRSDGRLYAEPLLGFIKNTITFRQLSEITPDDLDAHALSLPQLITPR